MRTIERIVIEDDGYEYLSPEYNEALETRTAEAMAECLDECGEECPEEDKVCRNPYMDLPDELLSDQGGNCSEYAVNYCTGTWEIKVQIHEYDGDKTATGNNPAAFPWPEWSCWLNGQSYHDPEGGCGDDGYGYHWWTGYECWPAYKAVDDAWELECPPE
jgi:hypothetical protein